MNILEDILETECRLGRYVPRHYHPSMSFTSGKTNRKQPYTIKSVWVDVYLIKLARYEGRCTLTVSNESVGYSKILSQATGLDQLDGEILFNKTLTAVKHYIESM